MTVGYWCLLIAILLPYSFAVIAKSGMKLKENQAPRESRTMARVGNHVTRGVQNCAGESPEPTPRVGNCFRC